MTLKMFDYHDGETVCEAAVAMPSRTPSPAVLICHQWMGQGQHEHKIAERLAALGYVAMANDVYGKGRRASDAGEAQALMEPWVGDRAALHRRLRAAVDFVQTLQEVDADRLAVIGYCFGGLCALDVARSGAPVRGVVSFHGLLKPDGFTDAKIAARVLVEHGWDDPLAPPADVLEFTEEMTRRGADWQLHAHGHAVHAFTNPDANARDRGMQYDAKADARSWQSLQSFLNEIMR